jgi:hypothetical protein
MTTITGGLHITGGLRIGAAMPVHSAGLSSGSYYFKIGTTGVVTKNSLWDAPTTPVNSNTMTLDYDGYWDDNSVELTTPWSVGFLGNTYNNLYVSGNGGFSFGVQNNMRDGNPNSGATDNNAPCLYMNNNDANLQQVYSLVTGTTGSRTLIYKVRGNTMWNATHPGVNYEYDIYFYENNLSKVDVVVNQEPTNWSAYNNSQGQVLWGVTDGTNWVDGLTYHDSSIGS